MNITKLWRQCKETVWSLPRKDINSDDWKNDFKVGKYITLAYGVDDSQGFIWTVKIINPTENPRQIRTLGLLTYEYSINGSEARRYFTSVRDCNAQKTYRKATKQEVLLYNALAIKYKDLRLATKERL